MNEKIGLPPSYSSAEYTCLICNQKTRINLKKKIVYSHVKLGTTTFCEGSSQEVDIDKPVVDPVREIVPVSGPAAIKRDSEAKKTKKIKKAPKRTSYFEYPTEFGNSVRTIYTGHPGSGKRK
ncbi:hypothetical protein [Corynebacterium glutamicum]|uniref:hypothetical protein n=1 Tax=Corynebacterium glutamicum TaxID=1718 RepID=UPI000771E6D0|nr:hypothetical protein [Corynebacterium glutamicum]AMK79460.1 hypothetical protein APT58_15315 [Corynebacterium glutamicum]